MCAQAIMRAHLKHAEREARDSAERANMSKANFVATISHELRTPINAVIGYTDLLSQGIDGPINSGQEQRLARMRASGRHLLSLIDELLSYARIEAGAESVRPEQLELRDIVAQSVELVRPLAVLKGLQLRMHGMDVPTMLFTDQVKLRQIFVNIIANGVKFTSLGEVAVTLRPEKSASGALLIDVTDTGIGINDEDRDHIFNPFWQKDPTQQNTAGSSGLGLSVARNLARLLGGDVVVHSSVAGHGTTFLLSLPSTFDESGEDGWHGESVIPFPTAPTLPMA
jgi:signal transduction histidine kinase